MYWIDPNRGCASDAINVHCNFTTGESQKIITCVSPSKDMSVESQHWGDKIFSSSGDKYFDENHNLGKLEYVADQTQLKYLGLLSSEASQNITIHCRDTAVWFNRVSGGYESAMKFRGMGDQVFQQTKLESKFTPRVLGTDNCAYLSKAWKQTVLEFSSRKFIRLPIVDFTPALSSNSNTGFGIGLGPVCFS